MTALDRGAVSADWQARGFTCDLWTDPPGQRWEDFVHDVDEVLMPVEGTLEVEIDGRVHRPAIGEELFIPAGNSHSVRNVGGSTARWLYGYSS